jgi:uncharacterized oxidoreductase
MQLSGHTVLITGGGSGIGLALAQAFIAAKNHVIICGRDIEKLKAAALGVQGLEIMPCDIRSASDVTALHARCAGRVNILVNNAAVAHNLNLRDATSLDSQMNDIDTNLLGMLRMVSAFLPTLATMPNSAIINVTSALAFVPDASRPAYSAAKAGMRSFTQSLRHQVRGTGVKVFELIPPLTQTAMAAGITGIPMLTPQRVASALMESMRKDRFEITPGLSAITKIMSRLAPQFAFKQLNK